MAIEAGMHKGIWSLLSASSNGNVTEIKVSPIDDSCTMACKTCKATYTWVLKDYNKAFGIDQDLLIYWCEQHKHEPIYNIYPTEIKEPVYKAPELLLDQLVMKKVWRWSDFNVDLRAYNDGSVFIFGAICTKCKDAIQLTLYLVVNNDTHEWDRIQKFGEEHRFCGTNSKAVEGLKGRKFKDE